MKDFTQLKQQLETRLADLESRAEFIEDDLRHALEADLDDQAIDLADDEALEGVDNVLRAEMRQIRLALQRIENGTYGVCGVCGEEISPERLKARPIATRCINCA